MSTGGMVLVTITSADERTPAEAITDKLLTDELLAREVYNRLEAERVRTRRENKRRLEAQNG